MRYFYIILFFAGLFLCGLAVPATAQWANTTNQFYDSLQTAVCNQVGIQQRSIVVRSYPDGGYFVIWEDSRDNATNKTDIYAQKYDKNGVRLWPLNGVPVATGPDEQKFSYFDFSNLDYRYYSFACTDSAGGFYMTWGDDNTIHSGSGNKNRVCVQHITGSGNPVFPADGAPVAEPLSTDIHFYIFPQLVADGNKGFFVAYLMTEVGSGDEHVLVQCLRDEGGILKSYGRGTMNDVNAFNNQRLSPCGLQNFIDFFNPRMYDYFIYPDGQHGCNVAMSLNSGLGEGSIGSVVAYNRMCRVKKASHTTVRRRSTDIALSDIMETDYPKDSVVQLFSLKTFTNTVHCVVNSVPVDVLSQYVENGGESYATLAGPMYSVYNTKAVLLPTDGNINVEVIANVDRQYDLVTNTVSNFGVQSHYKLNEIYDSLPYELTSDNNAFEAYNTTPPPGLNKINFGGDTLLPEGTYFEDFALAGGGNNIFAAARLLQAGGAAPSIVAMQRLRLARVSADSFAISSASLSKNGVVIGQSVSTGFTGTNIDYFNPGIAVSPQGVSLFYIHDMFSGQTRVSPIGLGVQLPWGAMGRAIGPGHGIFTDYLPTAVIDPSDGTALLTWADQRDIPPGSDYNIFMRHIDSLNNTNYQPPANAVLHLPTSINTASPGYFSGTSQAWSLFNVFSPNFSSPVAALFDNFSLGAIQISSYENFSSIRSFNGQPYLDRNYLITVANSPNGSASINVRLYFTQAEFDALKAANPAIINPGSLAVIKQPNTNNSLPDHYAPITGEETIVPTTWAAVDGGYYIEIAITSFSNFFIFQNTNPLPLTWLGVTAQWENASQAKVDWQVGDEHDVTDYTIQHSTDGSVYQDETVVAATGSSKYGGLATAKAGATNYYRVMEKDRDDKKTYSQTVTLQSNTLPAPFTLSPNPATEMAILTCGDPASRITALTLYGSDGKAVWKMDGIVNTNTVSIPLRSLSPGLYSLRVQDGHQWHTLRLLKL
jgi:hypothetical protein